MRRIWEWVVSVSLSCMCLWACWRTIRELFGARGSSFIENISQAGYLRDHSRYGFPERVLLGTSECLLKSECAVFEVLEGVSGGVCFLGMMTLQVRDGGRFILKRQRGKYAKSRLEQFAEMRKVVVHIRLMQSAVSRPFDERISCTN